VALHFELYPPPTRGNLWLSLPLAGPNCRRWAKDKSTDRIDGIVAIIMALGRAMLPEEEEPTYQVIILR
jgi:hypothetical protein